MAAGPEKNGARAKATTPTTTAQEAAVYDSVVVPRYNAVFAQLILEAVPRGTRARVLDIGCGTGIPSLPLLARLDPSSRVIAIDRDAALIDIARRRALGDDGRRIFFKCESADELHFGDEVFDIVVGNLALAALDTDRVLPEVRRTLAPGGRLLLTQALAGSFEEVLDMLREVALRMEMKAVSHRIEQLAQRFPTPGEVVSRATAAGFADATVREDTFKLAFRNARELFADPVVHAVGMADWRWAAGFETGGAQILEQAERALDVYFAGGALSLSVNAGLLEARKPR